MTFRITGLPAGPFQLLFGLPDAALAERGVRRYAVDYEPCFPDRVELRDARPGEHVLLLPYTHQPADTPYRASHAIFVREGAEATYDAVGDIPPALRLRMLSLRAFDAHGMMLDADLADGRDAAGVIGRLLARPQTAYLHAHYAKAGCYAARIDRA